MEAVRMQYTTSRSKLLTNSAAAFVEAEAGQALIRRATKTDKVGICVNQTEEIPLEFASAIDRFVPSDQVPDDAQYYHESDQVMQKFQETLRALTMNLRKRNVFDKLGVAIKDPPEYTLEYVLFIATKINENREESENASTCKKFINSCFRSAHKRSKTFTGLLDLVPKDIYGSVISGGFTLILTAVEEHEKFRAAIQKALAEIPRKLSKVQRLSDIPFKPPILHQHADAVLVAIFVVLERIIDWFLKSWLEKRMSKMKGQGREIQDALDILEEKVGAFQNEVEICSIQRLGRIEEGVGKVGEGLYVVQTQVTGFEKTLAAIQKEVQKEREIPDAMKNFFNALYRFSAANPDFNAIDGTITRPETKPAMPTTAITAPSSMRKTKEEVVQKWFSGLGGFIPSSDTHMSECLREFAVLDNEEKRKTQWIMGSAELRDWLSTPHSSIFEISAASAPIELMNAMTSASATLAMILATQTNAPVLSFFCGLRTNDSLEEGMSDHLGVLKSLNGQLLRFILDNRDIVELTFLEKAKMLTKSKTKPRHAVALFEALVKALPEQDVVFILIDSFSRLVGDNAGKVLEELARIRIEMPDRSVKILITDPLPSCRVADVADISLYIPEEIAGMDDDIEIVQLEEIHRINTRKIRRGKHSTVSGSEDSDSSESEEDGW
ncbi:hypothetical protein H2200_003330 [Cladophialophora chaetospira]|uniref:DUF7708 domain-containing protein n=1 Tax=Cladophialophora chaetospira TaxID=386627 RepID=A0AA38XH52_9EURO|nr:hypothetical protein H2200_003330 [Cladophialophora chaetospira]